MSDIKDGGPAFPESYVGADSPHEGIGNGMTLRDYFAAKAMQGILACESDTSMSADDCARFAYMQADAMLSERAK